MIKRHSSVEMSGTDSAYSGIRTALSNIEANLREIADASPEGVFIADGEGNCSYVNPSYQKLTALVLDKIQRLCWQSIIQTVNYQDQIYSQVKTNQLVSRRMLQRQATGLLQLNTNHFSRQEIDFAGTKATLLFEIIDNNGEKIVTESAQRNPKVQLESSFQKNQDANAILESIGDALMTTDIQNRLVYFNPAAETMTGWTGAEVEGRMFSDIFNIIDAMTFEPVEGYRLLPVGGNGKGHLPMDCIFIRRDGFELYVQVKSAPIYDREAQVVGAVHVLHDVSQIQIKAIKMAHDAQYDSVTDLPNRKLLKERLTQAIGLARRKETHMAVLFIDLDCFKTINDRLGHGAGDQLLRSVGNRLRECIRSTDTVCRLGGDEFVVLLTEIEQYQDAAQVAELLHRSFCFPHLIQGHEIPVSLSIGISVYPNDGNDGEALLHTADSAMYHIKASRRNSYRFFSPEMNKPVNPSETKH